jgi:chromosome segregation ATPase
MRTSSLKHTIDATANTSKDLAPPKTPSRHASKENVPSSPRKALAEIASNIPDSTEAVDSGKRALAALYQQNTALQNKLQAVESENTALIERHNAKITSLESELQSLVAENHRLEKELQISRAETALASMSPRHGGDDSVVRRLSEELAWHAKLHLYAERERLRLLDLLEFAGLEGRVVGREVGQVSCLIGGNVMHCVEVN